MTDRLDLCLAEGGTCASDPSPRDHATRRPTAVRHRGPRGSRHHPAVLGDQSRLGSGRSTRARRRGWGDRRTGSIQAITLWSGGRPHAGGHSNRDGPTSPAVSTAPVPTASRDPSRRQPRLRRRREATLGELAAGWIDDDDWPELDDLGLQPTRQSARIERQRDRHAFTEPTAPVAFDEDAFDEFDEMDEDDDRLVPVTENQTLSSRLGLGAVDPLLARLGAIVADRCAAGPAGALVAARRFRRASSVTSCRCRSPRRRLRRRQSPTLPRPLSPPLMPCPPRRPTAPDTTAGQSAGVVDQVDTAAPATSAAAAPLAAATDRRRRGRRPGIGDAGRYPRDRGGDGRRGGRSARAGVRARLHGRRRRLVVPHRRGRRGVTGRPDGRQPGRARDADLPR